MEEYKKWPGLIDQTTSMLALPIFPDRLQSSIVGRSELNFRVRDGNGWTLALINTNLLSFEKESKQMKLYLTHSSSQENTQDSHPENRTKESKKREGSEA